MNIDQLTIGEVKQLVSLINPQNQNNQPNPFIGQRVLCRTYSAGVHIGTLVSANGMEAQLSDSLRLWSWKDGGLSLSAIANNGVKSARINKTGNVFLTNVIEYIPTTSEAEKTYAKHIED